MSALTTTFEPRAMCDRCRRPASVCYCAHVRPIETRTRVVLLQHPRERYVAIGTAHMASLCLPNAVLESGVYWSGTPALARALSDPERPAALLFPGEGAIDVTENPPPGPVTLIVIDGTWRQARQVLHRNPELAKLPRYSFTPSAPSDYRIRKEPRETYVSTIEALVYVLGALEGDRARFQALLDPFRAMVDKQIELTERCRELGIGSRHRRDCVRCERVGPRLPEILTTRKDDLVCVVGEANAWPRRGTEAARHPDELVQWVAHRMGTGETFEALAAPRNPLAPRTTQYTQLSAAELTNGGSLSDLQTRWRSFLRDTDVVCTWGTYPTSLFHEEGGALSESVLDLRHTTRVHYSRRFGTLEELTATLDNPPAAPLASGRAGHRLAQLVAVARTLSDVASAS